MTSVIAPSALNPATRRTALERMRDEGVDVLVIGGGATGAGIALDAVTRGRSVGIVEAGDWAEGTSSRSSKLVHGGLRYLQQLDVKLVAEALKERELLLHTLAPHLVKPVSFLYPLQKRWERPYVATGVGLYDTLARFSSKYSAMPMHRHHSAAGVQRIFPGIKENGLTGAIRYWDGRVDDARLVLTIVRTAAQYGALAASRAEVIALHRSEALEVDTVTGRAEPRVTGVRIRDREDDREYDVPARVVIGATGVWTEATEQLAGAQGPLEVLASKGIHIVVPKDAIDGGCGIILQTEKSVLFVIPWERYWVIGTTDTPYAGDRSVPLASADDIDYVLGHANAILERPLTRDDVIGVWAGLRPLLQPMRDRDDDEGPSSTKLSREHAVVEVVPGFVAIAGGKLTTYRVMAQDAVDLALGKDVAKQTPSLTETTPLIGATGYNVFTAQASRLGASVGWDREEVIRLLDRYGSEVTTLIAMAQARPDLAGPLTGAPPYRRVEIAYGCTHEGALHLRDLMTTRTRLVYEVRGHALAAVEEIADIAANQLGWDESRRAQEVAAYREQCERADEAARAPRPASETTGEPAADAATGSAT